jgi:hypothetical protein
MRISREGKISSSFTLINYKNSSHLRSHLNMAHQFILLSYAGPDQYKSPIALTALIQLLEIMRNG